MKQKIIFLMWMLLSYNGVNAQNEKAVDLPETNADSIKTIASLNKEVIDKNKTIEELNTKIKKLKAEKERLDSTLRAEIKDGKAAKYKEQIKQLEQNLTKAQELGKKQIDALAEQSKKDSLTIVRLQNELNEVSVFRVKWLAQLADSVEEKWLRKPYSAIDVNELEICFKQYEEFASADERVADARDRLEVLLENSRLYQNAVSAVNSEYNVEVINYLLDPMRVLRDNTVGADNKSDVEDLCWQLENYSITVEIFQEVISDVNEAVSEQSTQIAAYPLVNATLEKHEKDSEYITAIQQIPWLAKQYREYLNALEEDSLKPNSVGIAIMNLKP